MGLENNLPTILFDGCHLYWIHVTLGVSGGRRQIEIF
jgi:hypothetical protein